MLIEKGKNVPNNSPLVEKWLDTRLVSGNQCTNRNGIDDDTSLAE